MTLTGLVAGRQVPDVLFRRPLGWRTLCAAPRGTGERKPIEVYRTKSQNQGPRLSPDGRIMTYTSNPSGRTEVYAIPFDPNATAGAPPPPDHGRSRITAATAWCSGGRTARSCITSGPIAQLWWCRSTAAHSHVRQASGAVPAYGRDRAWHRPRHCQCQS
jgi:hypothetical protein